MTQQTQEAARKDNGNVFKQATENFKSSMDAGTRFQQDAFKAVTEVMGKGESFDDIRSRMENVAADSIGLIRKNAEQTQKLFDEGCKSGLEMIRKSFAATNSSDKDMVARTREVWESAFDAMRNNMDMAAKTSTQAIENWSNFISRNLICGESKTGR